MRWGFVLLLAPILDPEACPAPSCDPHLLICSLPPSVPFYPRTILLSHQPTWRGLVPQPRNVLSMFSKLTFPIPQSEMQVSPLTGSPPNQHRETRGLSQPTSYLKSQGELYTGSMRHGYHSTGSSLALAGILQTRDSHHMPSRTCSLVQDQRGPLVHPLDSKAKDI